MASHPSETDIEQMLVMSAITRDEAIRRLKGNNNNLNSALNELFDDPDSTKYKWEEEAFSSDRNGAPTHSGASFQVQGPDEPPEGGFLGAPSRPPSRVNNTSPINRAVSAEAQNAATAPQDEMGDMDLQRALAESAEEAGLQPQQVGVTQPPQTAQFGPSNRVDSDSQWAMVLGSNSVQEVLPDPEPADRKREDDAPAFLKPIVDDHRLASLLTIYHEIPIARQTFLNPDNVLIDYGHDREWWMGKAIEPKSAVMTDNNNSSSDEPTPDDLDKVVREVQRLMAFLDHTERSYGSVDALQNLFALKLVDGTDAEHRFFNAWKMACEKFGRGLLIPLMFTIAVQPGTSDSSLLSKEFAMLDLQLPPVDSDEQIDTIYDLADEALWDDSGDDVKSSNYLSHLAEVVTFRIGSSSSQGKMVKIPTTWYADRYVEENREASLAMRRERAAIMKGIEDMQVLEYKLTYTALSSGQSIKVKDLFATAMLHDQLTEMVNGSDSDSHEDIEMLSRPALSGDKTYLTAELQKVVDHIDLKLKGLESEKEKARASLRDLSKLYTEESTDPNQSPKYKYTLRGVSINKYVTYVCRRAPPDLISMDLDASTFKDDDQWWKLEYSTSGSQPVNVTKVTQNEVLLAAYRDTKDSTCTAVYASEHAMATPQGALPQPLADFVHADNEAFRAEFRSSPAAGAADTHIEHSSPQSPRSQPKRKFDDADGLPPGSAGVHRGHAGAASPPPSYAQSADFGTAVRDAYASQPPQDDGQVDVIMGQDPGKSEERDGMVEMQERSEMPALVPGMPHKPADGDERMDVDNLPGSK